MQIRPTPYATHTHMHSRARARTHRNVRVQGHHFYCILTSMLVLKPISVVLSLVVTNASDKLPSRACRNGGTFIEFGFRLLLSERRLPLQCVSPVPKPMSGVYALYQTRVILITKIHSTLARETGGLTCAHFHPTSISHSDRCNLPPIHTVFIHEHMLSRTALTLVAFGPGVVKIYSEPSPFRSDKLKPYTCLLQPPDQGP